MLKQLRRLIRTTISDERLQSQLERLRRETPVPIIWLFGKTQSGKTSLIKTLTGAEEAEIGQGFKPCTRFSRRYHFPTADAPLMIFLDTRGTDEPGYDPKEDLEAFNDQAHILIVTIKVLDHAQESTLAHLRDIRRAQPSRPVLLVPTCLHEAYPQQQHKEPYPFVERNLVGLEPSRNGMDVIQEGTRVPDDLLRSLKEQYRRFEGVADKAVPVDFTRLEDGFTNPHYGREELKKTLLALLPYAYRQTFLTLDQAKRELSDLYAREALPRIVGYSTLAATAGAFPIPWVDLLVLPGIQSQMIFDLARFYGQPLSATRFLEVASSLGLGIVMRQAAREVAKLIPFAGSVAGGVLAGASTLALGKASCYYFSAVHQGHVPKAEDLRRYYRAQLALAEQAWSAVGKRREGRTS